MASASIGQERVAVRSGYLRKLGEVHRSYKRRWFLLTRDAELYYYKDPKQKTHQGCVSLKDAFVRVVDQDACGFEVVTPARIYKLDAPSKSEMELWVNELTAATPVSEEGKELDEIERSIQESVRRQVLSDPTFVRVYTRTLKALNMPSQTLSLELQDIEEEPASVDDVSPIVGSPVSPDVEVGDCRVETVFGAIAVFRMRKRDTEDVSWTSLNDQTLKNGPEEAVVDGICVSDQTAQRWKDEPILDREKAKSQISLGPDVHRGDVEPSECELVVPDVDRGDVEPFERNSADLGKGKVFVPLEPSESESSGTAGVPVSEEGEEAPDEVAEGRGADRDIGSPSLLVQPN